MSRLPKQIYTILGVSIDADIAVLPGYENENSLVKGTDGTLFVVKRLRTHSAHNTELEGIYRQYLADSGLPVSPYLRLSQDAFVLTLGQDNYVATPYITGKTATAHNTVAAEAGNLLAKIHVLDSAAMPKRQNWYQKSYITDSFDEIDDKYATVKKEFSEQYAQLPDFWSADLPKGIIHGDMHADNIIVDANDTIISIVDWEEAAVEPLLLDVAHTAQQLSFERGACNHGIFNAFMDAYQKVRPLTELEKQLFEAALRYIMLVLSVWAHIKMSRNEIDDALFQSVGGYYRARYDLPTVG